MLRFLPAAALLLLLPFAAPAQTAQTATGRVVAKTTGQPLPQTTVRLDGQPAGVSTDEAGRFRLLLAGAGPAARLVVSHLGYESQTLPVAQVGAGADVKLEELSYQIGEVVVTYERIRKLLLRKWKIDEGSLDAASQRVLAKLAKKDPDKAAKMAKNSDAVRSVLKLARYIFQDDGAVKVRVLLFGSTGQWQLDEQSRTLRVTNAKGEEALIAVAELSERRLVLQSETADQPALVYVPAD